MNIMVEAMTQGGFEPRGKVFLPADALGPEPVLFSYLIDYLDGVEIFKEGKSYTALERLASPLPSGTNTWSKPTDSNLKSESGVFLISPTAAFLTD